MKIYGHPWSINTRKTLMTLAEKGHDAELALVMIPKGEHKQPRHVALHPFGKVPVLEDDSFVLYETRAINAYLDRVLSGPPLTPAHPRDVALLDQFTNVADAYFVPHAMQIIMETVFRRYLGGERDGAAIEAGRVAMAAALDTVERRLARSPHLAGSSFSIADIHWMPYLEYFIQAGEGHAVTSRRHLAAWWERVSNRSTWQRVARSGPQPYEEGMTVDVVEKQYRK